MNFNVDKTSLENGILLVFPRHPDAGAPPADQLSVDSPRLLLLPCHRGNTQASVLVSFSIVFESNATSFWIYVKQIYYFLNFIFCFQQLCWLHFECVRVHRPDWGVGGAHGPGAGGSQVLHGRNHSHQGVPTVPGGIEKKRRKIYVSK